MFSPKIKLHELLSILMVKHLRLIFLYTYRACKNLILRQPLPKDHEGTHSGYSSDITTQTVVRLSEASASVGNL